MPDFIKHDYPGHGTIYNGDCIDLLATLPEKSIDLLLTDPPYGKGGDKQIEGRFGNKGSPFEKYRPVARTGGTWAEKYEKKNCSVGHGSNARGF